MQIPLATRKQCRRSHQSQGKGASGFSRYKLVHRGRPRCRTVVLSEDQWARKRLIGRARKRCGGRREARDYARRARAENGRNSYNIALARDEQAYPNKPVVNQ